MTDFTSESPNGNPVLPWDAALAARLRGAAQVERRERHRAPSHVPARDEQGMDPLLAAGDGARQAAR